MIVYKLWTRVAGMSKQSSVTGASNRRNETKSVTARVIAVAFVQIVTLIPEMIYGFINLDQDSFDEEKLDLLNEVVVIKTFF